MPEACPHKVVAIPMALIRWLSTLRNVTNCAPSTLMFLVRLLIIATPESEDSQDPDRAFAEISSLTEPEFYCPMVRDPLALRALASLLHATPVFTSRIGGPHCRSCGLQFACCSNSPALVSLQRLLWRWELAQLLQSSA